MLFRSYGPYKQSLRKEIYQSYAKKLIEEGKAYPCFCTPEDLDKIRGDQEKAKERTGYFGKWTRCRNMPIDMAIDKIKNGLSPGGFQIKYLQKGLSQKNTFPSVLSIWRAGSYASLIQIFELMTMISNNVQKTEFH